MWTPSVDCQTQPVGEAFASCYSCECAQDAADAALLRPCYRRCITEADAWDLAHPGERRDHSDGATGQCANCDNAVCLYCHETAAPDLFVRCDARAEELTDLEPHIPERWDPATAAELHRLAGRTVSAGGGAFPHVNGWINKWMGVRHRREANAEQLTRGVAAATDWLHRLREGLDTDPERWAGVIPPSTRSPRGRRSGGSR